MSSIFLSHNSKDKHFVRKLANDLRRQGFYVWVDEAEIKLGDSLIECVHRSPRSPRPAELSSRSAEIEQWHRPD